MAFFHPAEQQGAKRSSTPGPRGGHLAGDGHPRAKLSEQQVGEIKRRLAAGERNSALARCYGVTPAAITMIKTGRSWSHVQPPGCDLTAQLSKRAGRLTAGHASNACLCRDQVHAIKRSLARGQAVASLARDYGVSYQVIYNIKIGKNWRHVELEP